MLTDEKRRKIITLLANGSSRRVAAQYVGCAPSTITRTAARDPAFAEQLATAEKSAEIDALRYIRIAARKDRYWRAAAWILERKNPEDFARRPPTLFTGEEVFHMISQIVEILHDDLPEANCQRAIEKLEELIELQRLKQTTPTFPKPPITLDPCLPTPEMQHPSFDSLEVTTSPPAIIPFYTSTSDVQQ